MSSKFILLDSLPRLPYGQPLGRYNISQTLEYHEVETLVFIMTICLGPLLCLVYCLKGISKEQWLTDLGVS